MNTKNSNELFKIHWILWRILGILPPIKWRVLYFIWSHIFNYFIAIFFIVHLMVGTLMSRTTYEAITSLTMTVTSISYYLKFAVIWFHLKYIRNIETIFNILDKRIQTIDEMIYFENILKKCKRMTVGFGLMYASAIISPEMSTLFDSQRRLMFPAWFPLDWEGNTFNYWIVHLYQFIGFLFQVITEFTSDSFPPLSLVLLSGHIRLLAMKLSKLGTNPTNGIRENNNELQLCIKDHENLIELYHSMQKVFSMGMFCQIFVANIILCCVLFCLVFYANHFVEYAHYLSYLVAILLEIFPTCYLGSIFELEFNNLSYALFSSNWIVQDIEFKRNLIIFCNRSLQPTKFLCLNFFRLDLETFYATIKNVFIRSAKSLEYTSHVNQELSKYTGNFENHPCKRECIPGMHMTCYYKLVVHFYETMGPECLRCGYKSRECASENCLYGDGVNSAVVAINKMLPGPSIEVCENDTLIVDVINKLTESTTMHWHGIHMSETPDMDGAPFITQYPINPGETFRYKFTADRYGTIWYHSHSHWQRGLGAAGSFIIRQPKIFNMHSDLYDFDLTEHTIMIQDIVYNYNFDRVSNIFINGKGKNHVLSAEEGFRYEQFDVVRGNRYRFRVILNGVFNCPIEFSIDNHRMLIISTDGNDIKPVVASSFFMTSAERFDFILHADRYTQNYWVRVRGYTNCTIDNLHQGAILHYRGANTYNNEPFEPLDYDYRVTGVKVNPLDQDDENGMPITELRSLHPVEWRESTRFRKFYSIFGFHVDNDGFQMQIDNITYEMPGVSLLQSKDLFDNSLFCNKTTLAAEGRDCSREACRCVNVLSVPAYAPIEMIIVNYMSTTHPFHIHGYTFRVVGQGTLHAEDLWRVEEFDRYGLLSRNNHFPVEKDSAQVPGFGYIIIRFMSNNPGYWMYHCHIENHSILGMMAVLQIGEHQQMKKIRPRVKC